jgi:hypothetical protein
MRTGWFVRFAASTSMLIPDTKALSEATSNSSCATETANEAFSLFQSSGNRHSRMNAASSCDRWMGRACALMKGR